MLMSVHYGGRGPGHIARVQGGGPAKSLDFSTALPSGVTFSRGSSATYFDSAGVLQTASSNVARIDYNPATLVSRGLLIEEARTNFLTHSADASTNDGVNFTTVSTNTATAPDGTTTADTLTATGGAGSWWRKLYTCANDSIDRQFSIFLKKRASGNIAKVYLIYIGGATNPRGEIDVNLSTGAVTPSVGFPPSAYSITDCGSFYRVSVGKANDSSGNTSLYAFVLPDNTAGTEPVGVWGWQLEAGAFATSYIPTAGSTVARSADSASMTGTDFSSWWNASEGTFYFEGDSPGSGTRPLVSADDNTTNEKFNLYTSTLDPKFLITDGGATQADIDAGSITANTAFKFAAAFKANDCSASVNGGAEVNDTSATMPTVDRLRIGADQAGNSLNGHAKTFRFYATNKDTQALTA